MNIVSAMVSSIFIKGISSIVEVLIQSVISKNFGISSYGKYTFYVSLVECVYFLFFSSSTTFNMFYLSTEKYNVQTFKTNYEKKYVLPFIFCIIIFFVFKNDYYGIITAIIIFLYYKAFDLSTTLMSKKQQLIALLGEYLVGRVIMLVVLLYIVRIGIKSNQYLLLLYGLQFLSIIVFLVPFKKRLKISKTGSRVSILKVFKFQESDIASAIITYSPAILQYFFVGAFETGFIGILTILRKIINFVSGPTAKIFLPELSKLYLTNEKEKLRQTYRMIIRVQMVFIGTISAILISFPQLFLTFFNRSLKDNVYLFLFATICFLIISSLGPVVGVLQMTGNEKICNFNQWISIVIMGLIMIILRNNQFFAVYALSVQAVVEGVLEYYSVCKWLGENLIKISELLILWLPVLVGIIIINLFRLNQSLIAAFLIMIFVGTAEIFISLKDPIVSEYIKKLKFK